MNKNDLMKSIAEKGYDVGFGAKKHFATYDIIEKAPGWISFSALAFGIFALAISGLSTKLTSAIFIVLGVIGLYINFYDHKKNEYETAGITLTKLYNELKALYYEIKSLDETVDFSNYQKKLSDIDNRYYPLCISKQILFSDWYAHYKFFWEHQIDWIDELLNFNFFRDKVPLSLWFFILLITSATCIWFFDLVSYLCSVSKP